MEGFGWKTSFDARRVCTTAHSGGIGGGGYLLIGSVGFTSLGDPTRGETDEWCVYGVCKGEQRR